MALELDSFQAENGEYHAMSGIPLTIQVFDDLAVVNAYLRGFQTQPGGSPTFVTRRWHSVWKNEGGRWLQVSNFGYAEPPAR